MIATSNPDLSRTTPEYMSLPKIKLKLTLTEFRDNNELKKILLDIIRRNDMARYYEEVCREMNWESDKSLLDQMYRANASGWAYFESTDTNLTDSGKTEWREKLEYACKIGDYERAVNVARCVLEDESSTTSNKLEAAFGLFRVAYLRCNVSEMGKAIRCSTKLLDGSHSSGNDWCYRNKLKVYEALYLLATRNFVRAANLFLDAIPTFESYEILPYKDVVQYAVLAGMIALPRFDLDWRLNKSGIMQHAMTIECPQYKEYLQALYECHYTTFFRKLAWIELEMKTDPLLRPHFRYYSREMRVKAYSQLLQAYRTLALERMASEFGVTEEYVEREIARFIASGKLHCRIDKVVGCVVTVSASGCDRRRPPNVCCNRGIVYQNTIRKGDGLHNRIQKLEQVINF